MITFITALYPEAKELIAILSLKKNTKETHYQLFENDRFRLIISGSGMIAAATCVTRHFTLYPAAPSDLVVNLGIAGYVPDPCDSCDTFPSPDIGDLFLVSKITEQTTGRTFYPDHLYRNEFHCLPLITAPCVVTEDRALPFGHLTDMEASALYQALLPFFSPERMFFFKVISDFIGVSHTAEIQPAVLLSRHLTPVVTFADTLSAALKASHFEIGYTKEESDLIQTLHEKLPLTETTAQEVERLLRYVKLTGTPLVPLLSEFLTALSGTFIRGKKQAAPYLEQLRELVLEKALHLLPEEPEKESATSLYFPFFHTVYVEKSCRTEALPYVIPSGETIVEIDHYKDIFNRSHQNFAEQKKAPSLVLAKKTGTLIYEGAPVCQSFGNEHFYYASCMMNCIYHCDYCYLQGMYPSGHVVVFVNLKDYFREIELLLLKHPVYLCISYDTDLLATESRFGFVSRWLSFAAEHPGLTLEIRTKSGNPAVFSELTAIYAAHPAFSSATTAASEKKQAMERIIFAWTVSPDEIIRQTEHGAASLSLRMKALCAAKEAGFSVRLCFDPMIYHSGWKNSYKKLIKSIFNIISPSDLYDVSIGVFRISTEYLKNMRRKRPDSAIVQFPYLTQNGVSHYGTLSEEMIHYVKELLLPYLPAEKIFVWNGGI